MEVKSRRGLGEVTGRPGRVEEGFELGEGDLEMELKNGRRDRKEMFRDRCHRQLSRSK
jgi:hypothetical protein